MSNTAITLIDGVKVVVPDSLNLLSPYVLLEQQDWFEDEIKFLRLLLRPGQKVIDIGANFGTYALSMAKKIGPTGSLWAFEPTSSTASFLAQGIATNKFSQVTLDQRALSCRSGTAQLALGDQSEMNFIVKEAGQVLASETVNLATLDECMDEYQWTAIDFVKIDAEGEESNILQGGQKFLSENSPLIQFEIKAGKALHLDLVHQFEKFGYRSYRLVPELNVLVPFDVNAPYDGFLLNLFCCKHDCAAKLAAEGFLVLPQAGSNGVGSTSVANFFSGLWKWRDKYSWDQVLAGLPYAIAFSPQWKKQAGNGKNTEYIAVTKALSLYAKSCDAALSASERFQALEQSLKLLSALCEDKPCSLRLSSLARVAAAYGHRQLAVDALAKLSTYILDGNVLGFTEPFLPPSRKFEQIPASGGATRWLLAAALEELERRGSFSSFYTGVSAHGRLQMICDLGFASDEMKRRLDLLTARFGGDQTQPQA